MQKIILITVLFFGGLLSSLAQGGNTITVEFKGMKSDKGSLYVALYNTESSFLKKGFKGEVVKITDKKATIIFKDIPEGNYAISSFHDENNNKKMDANFLGIPKEPIGMSNDATGFMGPPKYKDAKFEVTKNITLTINVN